MIKAIIFDMGGVILNLDKLKEKLIEVFHPDDEDDFWQKLSVFESPWCRGEMDDKEFWEKASKEFGVEVDFDDVRDFWDNNFSEMIKVDESVLKLIGKLKGNYKLGLISNIIGTHARVIRDMDILGDFDDIIFSNEVGMAKDNEDIFRLSVERLNVDFDECVFIDDVQEFVDNADRLGMSGVLYEGLDKLKGDLKELDVVF